MSTSCVICDRYRPPEGIILVLGDDWYEVCADCLDTPRYFHNDETGESVSPRELWNILSVERDEAPLDEEKYPVNPDPRPYVAPEPYVDEAPVEVPELRYSLCLHTGDGVQILAENLTVSEVRVGYSRVHKMGDVRVAPSKGDFQGRPVQ